MDFNNDNDGSGDTAYAPPSLPMEYILFSLKCHVSNDFVLSILI